MIQQNFKKIWQAGQLGSTIQLFFAPKLEQNSSIAHGISLSWKKFLKKAMISRSLTGHLATLPSTKEKETVLFLKIGFT